LNAKSLEAFEQGRKRKKKKKFTSYLVQEREESVAGMLSVQALRSGMTPAPAGKGGKKKFSCAFLRERRRLEAPFSGCR